MPSLGQISGSQPLALRSPPGAGEKVAIVTALKQEVWPLGWKAVNRHYEGRDFVFFSDGNLVLVCGGVGAGHARRATEAIIGLYEPGLIVSAGFAGALVPELKVGDLLLPRWVIDAKDGSRHDTGSERGVLLSVGEVVGAHQKPKLAEAYGAQAVDMEAAAVARGAEAHGIRFCAVKVISDRLDSAMPPVGRFIDQAGRFQTARFAAYAALRPWLWRAVVQLGRNRSTASRVLRKTLIQESILGMAASNRDNS
jgi:adenosylhomocysteine nucleosidase